VKSQGGNWGTINRALVRGLDATTGGVLVEIPALAPGGTVGPIPTAVPNLAIGEAVLVANISTSRDTLVVLGRVPGRAPTVGEVPTLSATIAALQATDTTIQAAATTLAGRVTTAEGNIASNTSRLTTDEANIATNTSAISTHTHTTAPSGFAVTGNESVTGNLTVSGTEAVTGAASAASYAATGVVSAHSSGCTTAQLIAGQHTQYVSKIIGAAAAVQTRSSRQPVAHGVRASGLSVAITSTETQLYTANFVNKEDCNHLYNLAVGMFINAGGGTNVEPVGAFIRLKVVDNPGGTVRFDSGQVFRLMGNEYYQYSNQRDQPRSPISCADTYLWTAGSGFSIQIWGQLQTVLGAALDLVNGYIMEIVCVD
jgi:hypothetical protein